jgi:uncharacterized membrane protein
MGAMFRDKGLLAAGLVLLIAVGVMIPLYRQAAQHDTTGEDIYYAWLEGERIIKGENPYARVLAGDMRENQKYATYFPTFYWLSALSQLLGLRDFPPWIAFWRVIFQIFDLGIAALIFLAFYRERSILLGVLSALFWLFNRWTLVVLSIAHIDFLPLFFLLASLLLFDKRRLFSLLLFSLSLSIKQLAIFLLPVYLLWVWQAAGPEPTKRAKQLALASLTILSVPVVTSLPFLVWNAEGWAKSLIFSVTRYAEDHFAAPSAATLLGLIGIPAAAPMLGLLLLVYAGVLQQRIGRYTSVLLTMAVFLGFNAVLFRQYICWILPFIPLTICDAKHRHGVERSAARQEPQSS